MRLVFGVCWPRQRTRLLLCCCTIRATVTTSLGPRFGYTGASNPGSGSTPRELRQAGNNSPRFFMNFGSHLRSLGVGGAIHIYSSVSLLRGSIVGLRSRWPTHFACRSCSTGSSHIKRYGFQFLATFPRRTEQSPSAGATDHFESQFLAS